MDKALRTVEMKITVKAGSDFQYQCAKEILNLTAVALKTHFESRHKGNKVEYE